MKKSNLFYLELEEADIELQTEDLAISEDESRVILNRALNRAVVTLRKNIINFIRAKYVVKAGDLRDVLQIRKSNPDDLAAWIYTPKGVKGVPLYKFLHGKRKVPSTHWVQGSGGKEARPKVGVKVKILRGKSPRVVQGGFTSKMPSGHVGLFRRIRGKPMMRNPKKEAIEELYSLSPKAMVLISGVEREMNLDDQAIELLEKYMEQEISHIITKKQ